MFTHLLLSFLTFTTSASCAALKASPFGPIGLHVLTGPKSRASVAEFEARDARQALFLLKKKLGADVLHDLVQSDIDEADVFWHNIIRNSSQGHMISDVRVEALVSPLILNTTIFLEWLSTFANQGFPNRLVEGSPQHYFLQTAPGSLDEVQVIENWGLGPVTQFTVTPSERKPFMVSLPEFTIQLYRNLVLRDGTSIADEIQAFRDKPDGSGMEAALIDYYPSATPEWQIEDVSEHVSVELSNWMRFAYEDVVSGRFVPSTLALNPNRLGIQPGEL